MTEPQNALGVLLVNLGTPDAPTTSAIRRYLREFLSDPRVVNLPRIIWLPILYGFILPFRPKRLMPKYQYIWQEEGAPIRLFTAGLAAAVEAELTTEQLGRSIKVVSAMTYGNPSIRDQIQALRRDGINDFLILPLFPQYSTATTAAVFDKLASGIKRSAEVGDIRFVDDYYQSSAYIHALTKTLEEHASHLDRGAKLIFSFHGIPKSQERAGDTYPTRCHATAELLAHNLGVSPDQWIITFQSRFGPAPWLQPYTDKTLAALPREGVKRVVVVCPGFATDCLETLHEIQVENREVFLAAGGEQFTYVPALNANADHVQLIARLIQDRLYPNETTRR